ncbi:MAG: hypothetical protein ABSC06_33315 [Rhodopila sp.]|jgi:hypothetical protein
MILTFVAAEEGEAMPGTWDVETYRARTQKWRTEAETLPPGKERDACMVLAQGYANLATLIEKENEGRSGGNNGWGVARATGAFGLRCG